MSDYGIESPSTDKKEDNKVYVKFSLSKYPFLKSVKIGSKGTANFKGEITHSLTNEDTKIEHEVTFNDLSKKGDVRV